MSGADVDNWMPLWIGDYLADTMHLTTEQHGAYLLLLMHQWKQGELPDDDAVLATIARVPPASWRRCRPVLERFFTVADGQWVQGRAAREKARAVETNERLGKVRGEAGRKGAEARWGKRQPSPPDGNGGGKPDDKRNGKRMPNAWQTDGSPPPPPHTGERDDGDDSDRSRALDRLDAVASPSQAEPIDPDRVVPIRSAADRFDPGEPTPGAVIAAWLIAAEKRAGRQGTGISSLNPAIEGWVKAGVPHAEIAEAYRIACENRAKAGDRGPVGPSYVDAVLRGLRERAAGAATPLPPTGAPAVPDWQRDTASMLRKADELGLRVNPDWTAEDLRWHLVQRLRPTAAA